MSDDADIYRLHRFKATAETPLFEQVATATGLSRVQARRAMVAGLVSIAGEAMIAPKAQQAGPCSVDLRHGVRAAWKAKRHGSVAPHATPLTIVHRDSWVVVLDKAPGVPSSPLRDTGLDKRALAPHAGELLRRMLRREGGDAPFIGQVHRLDRDTSGCLCFALGKQAQRLIAAQFAGDAAKRVYRALVCGQPHRDAGELRGRASRDDEGRRRFILAKPARRSARDDDDASPEERDPEDDEGVESITYYKVLRRFAHGAEVELTLGTGRTHQIRTTMAAINCPVYGDRVYGARRVAPGVPVAPRLMLHALSLELDHPGSGERLRVVAPLPEAFTAFAKRLGSLPPAASAPR